MTNKYRVFPIVLALLLMVVSFVSPLQVSAAEYVDDLELVDYIDEIVVEGDQALVSYSIPIEPFGIWRGRKPDGSIKILGHGEIVNMSQDITTNTYQVLETMVNLGTFTPSVSGNFYHYVAGYVYSEDLKNITHMMYDGVLYEVSVTEETDTYIVINDAGDNYSFRGCYFYKETHLTRPNQLRPVFNDNEEHTILFGTMIDVTEVVREYDAIFGNLYPLGVEGPSYRVIDVSDLKSGASFDFSYTYDFLWQVTGTAGPLSSGFTAYFLDEDFALLSESCSNAHFTPELSDNRIHGTHNGTITVPEGAAYLYFDFSFPSVNVADCLIFQFLIKSLKITCSNSAFEANSKSMEVIKNKIDDVNQGITDMNNKLDDIYNGSSDDQNKADDFNNSIDDVKPGLDQNIDDLNSLDKPNITDVKTNPTDFVDQAGIDGATMILGALVAYPLCNVQTVCVIGLMLIAYVLHGKKG